SKIVPSPAERATETSSEDAHAQGETPRMSWARLLKRVFDIDVEHCPKCGGALKIIGRDRRSAGDCQNPHPSGPTHPRPAACPGAAIRSVPNNLRAKPVANAILRRANRALPATAPPELAGAKPRVSLFSLNSFTLTRLAVRRYRSPSEKKVV